MADSSTPSLAGTALKTSTRNLHEKLDSLLGSQLFPITRERVDHTLSVLAKAVTPLEEALEALSWPPALEIGSRLRRREWLAADGVTAPPPRMPMPPVPGLDRPGEAWGVLYVLEGSTLGGRALARQMFDAGMEPRYFQGYVSETGSMWKSFQQLLERHVNTESHIDEAAAAAEATFRFYIALFERE